MFYINEVYAHIHIDGLLQKRKDSPTSVTMGRRTPAPPRGGTSVWEPLITTNPKKWGGILFTISSVTGIMTQCTVCSTYSNSRPFWHLWHTMHWKHSYILHYKQHQFIVDTINSGVNPDVSLLQLLDRVNNGLHRYDIVGNTSLPIDTHWPAGEYPPYPRAVPHTPRVVAHCCAYPLQPLHQKTVEKDPQHPKLCSPKVKIQHSLATKGASVTCQSSTSSSS